MRGLLSRWVADRRRLAGLWHEIRAARAAAYATLDEMQRRRDGFTPDRRFDGAIDSLLDLADDLGQR